MASRHVEADAFEGTEQLVQPGDVRGRQGRLQDRFDVALEMLHIAGAEQHHVGAGLVAGIAIGGIDHAGGTASWIRKSSGCSRSASQAGTRRSAASLRMVLPEAPRHAEDAAHNEHQERADPVLSRVREHGLAGVLVHHVEREHHHLPAVVLHRALQHQMLGVVGRGLGDAEVAKLALGLLALQRRHQLLHRVVVGGGRHAVELEQVHIVGAQRTQRVVQAVDHLLRRPQPALLPDLRLGRDHDAIARQLPDRLADDRLGAVGRRGIQEIDPEVDRVADQGARIRPRSCPSLMPSRLLPPQPRPATLTRRPVLPSVVYCMAISAAASAARPRCPGGRRDAP